jgi:hypothetical protein
MHIDRPLPPLASSRPASASVLQAAASPSAAPRRHFRLLPSSSALAMTLLPALAMLLVVALAGRHVPVGSLTRDVTTTAGLPAYTGALSSLGILLWCATTAICLTGAWLRRTRMLLSAAAISGYMMLDDQFQLHEAVLPRLLGIGETAVYLLLAAAVLAHLLLYRAQILRSTPGWLFLSLALLGASVGADVMFEHLLAPGQLAQLGQWSYFIEDGFKWLGICCWSRFHIGTALMALSSAPAE